MSATTTAGARADQPAARSASQVLTILGPFIGLILVIPAVLHPARHQVVP